jgi:hypothetical protein
MKKENNKIILIPPCCTYGDCLSVVSMIYFFLEFYNEVYFYIQEHGVSNYYECYFSNDPNFNKRIFLIGNPQEIINNGGYGDYHICNTLTGDWQSAKEDFKNLNNINPEFYFNDLNPIYNKINIPEKYLTKPNTHLPNLNLEINHLFYYKLVGLNNSVRMDFFNYYRNLENEQNIKKDILNGFGIDVNDKYNIINDPVGAQHHLVDNGRFNNDYPVINTNFLSSCPGNLLSLLESAESIHFIEGSNVNFFYHCQYKNIFNYKKKIHFHISLRNRMWDDKNMNLDYAWKMMSEPKLPNWEFIF